MKVERKDLFDFKVVLDEQEFGQLLDIVSRNGIGIEQAFADTIETGLYVEQKDAAEKR